MPELRRRPHPVGDGGSMAGDVPALPGGNRRAEGDAASDAVQEKGQSGTRRVVLSALRSNGGGRLG